MSTELREEEGCSGPGALRCHALLQEIADWPEAEYRPHTRHLTQPSPLVALLGWYPVSNGLALLYRLSVLG